MVVLNTGDPVFIPWAGSVTSILEMWSPGQLGGPGTADILLGKANPGGRLPVTFPSGTGFPTYDPNCTDTSATGNCPLYPGVAGPSPFLPGATTSYRTITGMSVNGIYQGYRWYDKPCTWHPGNCRTGPPPHSSGYRRPAGAPSRSANPHATSNGTPSY